MNLTDNLLGDGWYWAAWAVWVPLFVRSVRRAPWRRLADATQLNVWLGMVVILTLVWSLKAGVKPGLDLHMLGARSLPSASAPTWPLSACVWLRRALRSMVPPILSPLRQMH